MAAPKGGIFGKILDIDLTTGTHKVRTYDEALARKLLGGTGLATYFMWKEIPKGTDPMSPENLLIFASGPLCGTECPGARLSVNFKSPVSGGLGNSFVGGGFSSAVRWAGYDMIIMRGKAPSLSYIYIEDDKVEIRDASAMAGTDTFQAEEMIKEDIKNPDAYCIDGTFYCETESYLYKETNGNNIVKAERINEHWWYLWTDYDGTERSYQ